MRAGKTHNCKFRGPLEKPRKLTDYVFCQLKKYHHKLLESGSGALVFLCTGATVSPNFFHFNGVYCFLDRF
jgi:hypothetical protein